MYVCSRRYKVYVLTKILLTFKCICAQEDFTNFINFKCICAQEDYTFYQKFLGVPTLGVNTKTRRSLHCYCLTSVLIFLIRFVLQISIPASFELLKPSLNKISHSIHLSIF